MPLGSLLAKREGCPAVSSEATYSSALRLDDQYTGKLAVASLSRRSFTIQATFTRAGDSTPAVSVRVVHVWVEFQPDGDGLPNIRSMPIPPPARALLEART
jgi:acyl-CoA thioesterase FadM